MFLGLGRPPPSLSLCLSLYLPLTLSLCLSLAVSPSLSLSLSLSAPPPPPGAPCVSLYYRDPQQSCSWQQLKFWSRWFLPQTIRLVNKFHVPQRPTNYPLSLSVSLTRGLLFTLFASPCNSDLTFFHVHVSVVLSFACSFSASFFVPDCLVNMFLCISVFLF